MFTLCLSGTGNVAENDQRFHKLTLFSSWLLEPTDLKQLAFFNEAMVSAFSEASLQVDHGHLSYLFVLLAGPLSEDSFCSVLSWMIQKHLQSAKLVVAAKSFAASEAAIAEKILTHACLTALMTGPQLVFEFDSRDHLTSLSKQHGSKKRSTRTVFTVACFDNLKRGSYYTILIPGRIHFGDSGTEKDNVFTWPLLKLLTRE